MYTIFLDKEISQHNVHQIIDIIGMVRGMLPASYRVTLLFQVISLYIIMITVAMSRNKVRF